MRLLATLLVVFIWSGHARASASQDVLERSGVKGGVVVVIGCEYPEWLTGIGRHPCFVVQGLDADPERVVMAREQIRSEQMYGPVSANEFDGEQLPYADDLVNLVVASVKCRVAREEMMRVLAPNGVIIEIDSDTRHPTPDTFFRKPIPSSIDDWSHYLYGPNNNAVSRDAQVGPLGSLKWQCGPLWSRSHEFTSSLSILVSAGGRVFYVVDEGITSITTPDIPERWVLIARDAFNGKELWRMPLPEWRSRLSKGTALRSVPPTAQRCLVADKDRVYLSSRLGAPIQALDAATGKVLKTYDKSAGTREFIKIGDAILLYREAPDAKGQGKLVRINPVTGEEIWSAPKDRYKGESLGASEQYVIYHNTKSLVCLDAAAGKVLWNAGQGDSADKKKKFKPGQATYMVHDDVIIEGGSAIIARNARTGKVLWQTKTGGRAMRGHDCFVAQGAVWHAAGDQIIGYDLKTGENRQTLDPSDVQSHGHHLRCYRAKATENYLITQYRGVEFIGMNGQGNSQTDWTRGACSFGVVPANGLLYVPPNPCFCYPGVKVRGLNAFMPRKDPASIKPSRRLTKGPAYGKLNPDSWLLTPDSWTTYRHDPMRHGSTENEVPERLSVKWDARLGGKVSPPVMAYGQVFVAVKDEHTIYALDSESGKTDWRFTAGARVDSPPTLHQGLVLFGSADGYVYCVTADQGELVWKFRAAPADRMIMISDQLESAWPVHGSVLLIHDTVYCTAGRSTMLDGGIWLYGLNPATGELLHQARVDTLSRVRNDVEGQPHIPSYVASGSHSDILVSEGDRIYMGSTMFDVELNRLDTPYAMDTNHTTVAMDISREGYTELDSDLKRDGYEAYRSFHRYQEKAWPEMTKGYQSTYGGMNLGDLVMGPHIAPTSGFLDDAWFNRTYWMYSNIWPGWYHAHRGAKVGQLLVVGDERTYAVQSFPTRNRQSPLFFPETTGYLLTADANDNEPVLDFKTRGATKGIGFTRMNPPVWYDWVPIRIRGMVKAGDLLFAVGAPDVVPADDPMAAFEGRRGAILRAVSATDGKILSQRKLGAPPVFDGLIAASGCLFMSTEDHRVVCLAGTSGAPSPEERGALTRLQAEQADRLEEREKAARNRTFGSRKPSAKPAAKTGSKPGSRLPQKGLLPRDGWRVVHASSVESKLAEFKPEKILDGKPMTSWHSKWVGGRDPFPHEIVVDLVRESICRGIHILPRQDRAQNGRIKKYVLYGSVDGKNWNKPLAQGDLPSTIDEYLLAFDPVTVRYFKLVVESGYDENLTAVAELNVLGEK